MDLETADLARMVIQLVSSSVQRVLHLAPSCSRTTRGNMHKHESYDYGEHAFPKVVEEEPCKHNLRTFDSYAFVDLPAIRFPAVYTYILDILSKILETLWRY